MAGTPYAVKNVLIISSTQWPADYADFHMLVAFAAAFPLRHDFRRYAFLAAALRCCLLIRHFLIRRAAAMLLLRIRRHMMSRRC